MKIKFYFYVTEYSFAEYKLRPDLLLIFEEKNNNSLNAAIVESTYHELR